MTLSIATVARLLGMPIRVVMADEPFARWEMDWSVDLDLDPVCANYVVRAFAVDVVCDATDRVRSIFLHSSDRGRVTVGLVDLPFDLGRSDVVERLGPPANSGQAVRHPVLGDYGPWDRFPCGEGWMHVQYSLDTSEIERLTFMRDDAVPEGSR